MTFHHKLLFVLTINCGEMVCQCLRVLPVAVSAVLVRQVVEQMETDGRVEGGRLDAQRRSVCPFTLQYV